MKMTFEELESEFEKRVRKLNPTNIFDMAEINQKSAEILGEIVSENVFNFYNVEAVCKCILRRYYDKVNKTNSALQKQYDEKHGLQIAPQKADFPTERVTQIAESLTDKTVPPETIQRRARNAIENVANSFHDDYVRKNAEFRSRAGIKCYIVRETNGKCCEWCSSLAGRYVCSDAPDDIFRRHDNCTCTVTFENGRERQNVWSKKKWQVSTVLKVPYQPFVPEKSQAENLQKNQLAKYIGLDKLVTDTKQTEMRDFIKQTKQNRDYFGKQNYVNIEYSNKYTSDFTNKTRRNIKSAFTSNKVISYKELPLDLKSLFEEGLKYSDVRTAKAIKQALKKADIMLVNSKSAYYTNANIISIQNGSPMGTIAHETFHYIDHKYKINKKYNLSEPLQKDWKNLLKKSNGNIVGYLKQSYPEAFTKNKYNDDIFKKEYRGISDIISGLSKDQINLGYHHHYEYWKEKGKLKAEAWAQFGRIYYDNDDKVRKMFSELFTNYENNAIICLEEMI